ncbi:MAG: endonuclease III [bacterium]|nr:endonuclease III [bacterium]
MSTRVLAIVRVLRRATCGFPKPMGTAMVAENRTLFQLLVSTVCSAQTKDTTTYPVMQRLFEVARTPEDFVRMSIGRLRKLLYPISYYNTKAKHLKELSRILINQFGGRVPGTMDELLTLPGVGRKTANLVLGEGMGKVEGICVDTHVHRISNRLGIVRTASREKTERALMRVLPKKYWTIWNPLLVMWGQNVCTPISPKCSLCPIRQYCQRRGVTTSR